MSIGRRLVGDTLVFGFATIAARGVSLLLLPLYTRFLGAAEYGAFDVLMSLNRALFIPASLGMDSGLALAWRGKDRETQLRVTTSCLVVQLIWLLLLVVVLAMAAPPITRWLFGGEERVGAVDVVLLLLAAQVLSNYMANLAKWQRDSWRFLVVLLGTAVAAGSGSAIMVAGLGRGAVGAVTGLAIGTAAFLPIGFLLIVRHLGSVISLREMLTCVRLGFPFAVNGAAELAFPLALRLILLSSGGLAAVGVFGAANTLSMIVSLLAYAFSSAWWPFALSPEGARTRGEWPRILRLLALLQIVPVVVLTLLAPPLATTVLGGGSYAPAAALIGPVAFAYWIKTTRMEGGVAFTLAGSSWLYSAFGAAAIGASLLFAALLTPRFGLTGTAWGMVLGEAAIIVAQSVVAARTGRAIMWFRPVMIMAAAFIALMAATVLIPNWPTAVDLAARLGLGALFTLALLAFRVVPLGDISHAGRLLRDRLSPRRG